MIRAALLLIYYRLGEGALQKFINSTRTLTPDEKAEKLENDEVTSTYILNHLP